MATVELFGFAPSTYVRTARMVCEEKGIEYSLLPLDFGKESHRALHPYLRMPVLRHGALLLFETLAIATYLNEGFPGPDLNAGTVTERARIGQWISAASDYIYEGIVGEILKLETIDPKTIQDAVSLLLPVEETLAKHDFLVGGEITLADLFLFPMLSYANTAIGKADWLSTLPHVAQWLKHLETRPSVEKTAS